MDKEKAKKIAQTKSNKPRVSVKEYLKGVKTEIKKVVWPTRKELGSYTGVVLLSCVALSLAIWAVDSAFLASLKYVLNISF
ncbi:MAG: preprotein translocase subunit SecE [Eubacteriales bacterium]|nr:preprotein translocase subunit SecE [Eubacteriales bacterium]MDD4630440.1 preprotein translocase subunit SecE [Eubacteriales bacterium]